MPPASPDRQPDPQAAPVDRSSSVSPEGAGGASTRAAENDRRFHELLLSHETGFAIIKMLFDDRGRLNDYVFLEVNSAFGRHTGLYDVIGRRIRELVPNHDEIWFEKYGAVALTGESVHIESHAVALNRWFDAYALRFGRPEDRNVAVFFSDVTASKRSQEALRRSEEQLRDAQTRLQAALLAGNIATWTFDLVNDRVVADANLARLFSVDLEDAAGGRLDVYLQAIHPEDRVRVSEEIGRALESESQFESEYRVVLPDGSNRWLVARGKIERDEAGKALAMPGVVADITTAKETAEEIRIIGERMRLATQSANVGTWDYNPITGELFWDEQCRRLYGLSPEAAVDYGTFMARLHPDDREYVHAVVQAALDPAGTGAYSIDYRTVGLEDGGRERWVLSEGQAYFDPARTRAERFVGSVLDITERRLSEERERKRLIDIFESAPAFMAVLRGPHHLFEIANPPYLRLVGGREIIGKPVAEALPEVVAQGFIALLDQVYLTGEPFVGRDVPILLQAEPGAPLEEHFLDFTYQPLLNDDGTVSGILAHGIDLTRRKRLEQEQARLLEEQRTRAEREALLNRIGSAVRAELEPDAILQAVVSALGEALKADRCYFARYDQARDIAQVGAEWLREKTLSPMLGRPLKMSTYSVDLDPVYRAGGTHVVDDVVAFDRQNADALLDLNIRALLRVPIAAGNQMTALAVAMAYEPRAWTDDEIGLVEHVAALVHSTLESAHIQQRERNIAQQLQEALQPPPPPDLPGLTIKGYYRPALEEAGVGGDFYDVFPLGDGSTAIVVGDLSGKGLHAASEVATVRNMTRYALYSRTELSAAIGELDRILAGRSLLTGFATLFVGVYYPDARRLDYVNCGQEPALLRRAATGAIEMLSPTGPVLGGFEGDNLFEQKELSLEPGDCFAIFTDGMTDAGPSRRNLLGVAGIEDLLLNHAAQNPERAADAQAILDSLVTGVDSFSAGSVLDDIALLVGVVAPG